MRKQVLADCPWSCTDAVLAKPVRSVPKPHDPCSWENAWEHAWIAKPVDVVARDPNVFLFLLLVLFHILRRGLHFTPGVVRVGRSAMDGNNTMIISKKCLHKSNMVPVLNDVRVSMLHQHFQPKVTFCDSYRHTFRCGQVAVLVERSLSHGKSKTTMSERLSCTGWEPVARPICIIIRWPTSIAFL